MNFYRDRFNSYYWGKVYYKKITAIYQSALGVILFFKNGYKEFYLNGIRYGNESDFTKESWRRFVKMKTFL